MIRQDCETTDPRFDRLAREDGADPLGKGDAPGGVQAHKEQTGMSSGLETPDIGKIEILRD